MASNKNRVNWKERAVKAEAELESAVAAANYWQRMAAEHRKRAIEREDELVGIRSTLPTQQQLVESQTPDEEEPADEE